MVRIEMRKNPAEAQLMNSDAYEVLPGEEPLMFVPHTDAEREEMLRAIGVDRIEDLFTDVPADYRFPDLTCLRDDRNGSHG
jgi:hypothetical protein